MSRLVIIPTYNERENIKILLARLFKWIPDCEILVIDDNSPDGTSECVAELSSTFPKLHLLTRDKKLGLGSAYRLGFAWGLDRGFQSIIEMDADLSHRVRDLVKLLAASDNFDLVIGSRWVPGGQTTNWSRGRELLSRVANKYVRFALRIDVNDSTAGFRIYSSKILRALDLKSIKSEGYSFQIEMTRAVLKKSGKVREIPITFRERESGVSKMSRAIVIEAIWLVTIWGFKRVLLRK